MKILATDFDNTLFNGNDYIKNIRYVNQFVDNGNIFAIITGRYRDSLLKDIKDTGLKYSYLICNDGGIIFDRDLNVLYQCNINKDTSYDIATLYEQSRFLSDWYIDTGITITKDKDSIANGLIGRFNNRDEAVKLLNLIKDKHCDVDGYVSERWINITDKSVNKGSGIKHLADIVAVPEKDVYTIGDNINDVPMSNYDFNSYRMTESVIQLSSKTKKAYNAVYELIEDILKDGLK